MAKKVFPATSTDICGKTTKLGKTPKFPLMFNPHAKRCICQCDFTLKLSLYILYLQSFCPGAETHWVPPFGTQPGQGGSNAFCFPFVFQVHEHLGPYCLTQNQRKMQWPSRCKEILTDLQLTIGSELFLSSCFQDGNHKEFRKSMKDFRKEGNGEVTLTNSTKASPP